MERKCLSNELQRLIEAIKASDVVESRVKLLNEVRDLELSENSDVAYLIECLTVLDILGRLHLFGCNAVYVEQKYFVCGCKICRFRPNWVFSTISSSGDEGKHVVWEASEDDLYVKRGVSRGRALRLLFPVIAERSGIIFGLSCNLSLLSEFLSFSADSFSALMRYPVSNCEASMIIIEKFIMEQLNLTKDAISESKIINSVGLDIIKVAQTIVDAVIRLCKEYSQAVNVESCDARSENDKFDSKEPIVMNHVANITKCAVERLSELGILAASGGGTLVTVLNVSWKGVVSLLQLGKGALAVKVNAADIIVTLISLVNESLRCTAEAWSSSLKEAISVNEARRTFVPVKFYLINAIKIASLFPSQAYTVYKEITLCVVMISSLRISLSHEKGLKVASEVLTELLERSSLDLLNSLLNSALVRQEKLEILDWLFTEECNLNPIHGDPSSNYRAASIDEIFSLSCGAMSGARMLLPGRVGLFLSFLMYSLDLEEDTKFEITRKLGWFLEVLTDEEVYSSILVSQIPVLYSSGKTVELVWETLFSALLHALKTFMIVVSSCHAWEDFMFFLFENFFHPHFLCWEIVMELWCFLVCHAEVDLVNGIIDKLCTLMKSFVSPESVLVPGSTLRKMARSICVLLTYSGQFLVDKVYNYVANDDRSQSSSIMFLALLLEGFPINSLSDNIRSFAKQKIITDYCNFIERFADKSFSASSSGVLGVPVFALSASLPSLQVGISDIDMKTLKFLVSTIRSCRNPADQLMKNQYCKLLSETLGIISNMKHLYAFDEMEEVILELQDLFISGSTDSDIQLYQCKAELALFMAGFGEVEMSESDDCAKSCAVWKLYHMLFQDRHWALVHLALAAFGYFSERTTCNQLWRFVPQDAALSYDLESGNEPNEERFMSEFKAFLEKELALLTVTHRSEQLGLLVKEGLMLREVVQNISNMESDPMECQSMELDGENQSNKRRKLPDELSKGMELLRNGLKVIGDGISHWQQNQFDSTELQEKLLASFSRLEDAISHLAGLTDSG
ncbi:hypothetical protein Patl1_25859 [Pistacia atlantica]|uniref:Uncharacterized protein n=1 Tax=Pistacia atlantica TaxID=434234 RepID=A0ACC1B205_9ROSI|nr:hypothetical protein Patl1_25859 [Pistacia atlantica]